MPISSKKDDEVNTPAPLEAKSFTSAQRNLSANNEAATEEAKYLKET